MKLASLFDTPKLAVELVPRTCWFSNVRDHVEREVWDELRRPVFDAAGHLCEVCGGHGDRWPVECHEIWEYDDSSLLQRLTGLIALCPDCHQVKHIGLAIRQHKAGQALEHLCKVNGWATPRAAEYVRLVFDIWELRSKLQWRLDLKWLDSKGIRVQEKR